MINCLILVLWLQEALGQLQFFASPRTPFDLQKVVEVALSEVSPRPEVLITFSTSLSTFNLLPSAWAFDYTYSLEMTAVLRDQSSTVFSLWSEETADQYSTKYATAFARYLLSLNITRVRLISDTQESNLNTCHFLLTHFPVLFESQPLQVPADLTQALALDIGRLIKSSGNTVFALFTDRKVAACLLSVFEIKRLNKAGYAFIVSEEAHFLNSTVRASLPLARHGLLYVARQESWMAANREEAEVKILVNLLKKLRDFASLEGALQRPVPDFYLVNMQNSHPTLIAVRPSTVTPQTKLVFPGNSTSLPTSAKVSIPVSINSVWLNSDGSVYPPAPVMMRGGQLAIESANNRSDILPNFVVNWKSVSLSGLRFNYTFTKKQIERYKTDLGLFHMPPSLGVNIIQTSSILKDLNLSVPMAIGSLSDVLASPTQLPFYLRTRTGNRYYASVIAQIYRFFKWKRLAVLYKADSEELYRNFLLISSPLGLNITNDEDKRAIAPGLSTDEEKGKLNASLAHIMKSDVRILMIISFDITTILEQMYDIGIRNEYLLITSSGLSYTILNGNGTNFYKRRVVAKGALQFFPRMFVGKEGQKVRQMMIARDGMNYFPNGCIYFDCGMLYLHATDYMLGSGLDYEDTAQVVEAMRGTHFVGCAGLIRIGQNSNERSEEEYSLINVVYFEGNDSVIVQDAVYYNPFSATLIKVVNPIHWPDNSTGLYLDTLNSTFDCPFLLTQIQNFAPGVAVGFSVCFTICVITAGVTFFI